MIVSFYRTSALKDPKRAARLLPTVAQFRKDFRAFRKRYPQIKKFSTWNEINFKIAQPTGGNPKRAGQFYKMLRKECRGGKCSVLTGDFRPDGSKADVRWQKTFLKEIGRGPHQWGLIPYLDTNRFQTKFTKRFLKDTKRGNVYVTEVGPINVFPFGRFFANLGRQNRAMKYTMVNFPRVSSRIKAMYIYHWRQPAGAPKNAFDSALIDQKGKPRPRTRRSSSTWDARRRSSGSAATDVDQRRRARTARRRSSLMGVPSSCMRSVRGLGLGMVAAVLAAAPAGAADPVMIAVGDVACDPADTALQRRGWEPMDPAPGRCHQKVHLGHRRRRPAGADQRPGPWRPPVRERSAGQVQRLLRPHLGPRARRDQARARQPRVRRERQRLRRQRHRVLRPTSATSSRPRAGRRQSPAGLVQLRRPGRSHQLAHRRPELRVRGRPARPGGMGRRLHGRLRAGAVAASGPGRERERLHARLLAPPDGSARATIGDNPIMAPIWNALYEDYADIVLAGHDHNYERLGAGRPDGRPRAGQGHSQLGGRHRRQEHETQFGRRPCRPRDVRDNTSHGVLKLTLHGAVPGHPRGWYEWAFVGDGQLREHVRGLGRGRLRRPARPAHGHAHRPRLPRQRRLGQPAVAADRTRPVISRARLSRSRFRVGARATAISAVARGTTVAYSLSEAATAVLRIDRRVTVRRGTRRVVRYRRAGALRRSGRAGPRRVAFSGRIGRRALRPGRYRLTISARDGAGNAGRRRVLRFTVVR